MSEDRTLILVLGMHRSGTSVLTRVLNLLGADVGTGLLQAQPGVNARGFWEHEELIAINEALLSRLKRSWYDFQPLPRHWWSDDQMGAPMTRAISFLTTAFAETAPLAVIKDPRLCVLLPFWKEAARRAGWKPLVILATRAPWEVSASLCRRDPLSSTSAGLLWLRYTRESEKNSRELPRSRVDYAALLEDWQAVLSRVAKELALDWPQAVDAVADAVASEIDPGLRHQYSRPEESAGEIAAQAAQVYHLLRAEKLNEAELDVVWQDFDRLFKDCSSLVTGIEEANQQLFAVNNDLQALGESHQQALDVVAVKDKQLDQLANELEHAVSVVEERDDQLQYFSAELEHAGSVVKKRDAQLKQLQDDYQKLRSHVAIKVMAKLFSLDKQ